jgi:hypothetical protein
VRAPDGRFIVLARAPRCAVPPETPTEGPVEWMEVGPARSRGARLEAPTILQRGAAADVPGASVMGLPIPPASQGAGVTSGAPPGSSRPGGPSSAPSSPTRSGR